MAAPLVIRSATGADAPRLLAIYRLYVEHTAVSFELEPPSVEQFAARVAKSLAGWAWLVAELDGETIGYAYGTAHRERAAYAKTVETAVYVDGDRHGRGAGTALYGELLRQLAAQGFHRAVAGITLPNPASVALHERVWYQRGLG